MPMGLGLSLGIAARGSVGAYDPVVALGTDLLEFWDAEKLTQLTLNGSEVVTWASGKSGLAPTQATQAARPLYNATGLNGRPCVVFDGVDDQLTAAGVGNLPSGAATCEVWMLGSQDAAGASAGSRIAFSYGNGGATGQYRSVGRGSVSSVNRGTAAMGTGAADIGATGTLVDMSGVCLIRARMTVSQLEEFINGVTETVAVGTLGGTATTRTRLGAYPNSGGANFWLGKIAAIYVTNLLGADKGVPLASYFAQRGGF